MTFTKALDVDGSVIYWRIIRYMEVDSLTLSATFKMHTAVSTMKKGRWEKTDE